MATTCAPLPTLAQESLAPGAVATNAAGDTLLVRATPGWDGAAAGEVAPGAQVTVSDYPVTAADGSLWVPVAGGYVPAYALGSAPAAAPEVTTQVSGSYDQNGTWVEVTGGPVGEWQPVNCHGGSGYVHAAFIAWTAPTTAAVQPTPEQPVEASAYRRNRNNRRGNNTSNRTSSTGSGQVVADCARQYQGYPYVYAGAGPAAFDCSGFPLWVIRNTLGIDISHDLFTQYDMGTEVERSQLQPGDLVFFQNTFRPGMSHSGVYLGGGQFIPAENEATGVTISDLNSDYYSSRWYGAVRFTQ